MRRRWRSKGSNVKRMLGSFWWAPLTVSRWFVPHSRIVCSISCWAQYSSPSFFLRHSALPTNPRPCLACVHCADLFPRRVGIFQRPLRSNAPLPCKAAVRLFCFSLGTGANVYWHCQFRPSSRSSVAIKHSDMQRFVECQNMHTQHAAIRYMWNQVSISFNSQHGWLGQDGNQWWVSEQFHLLVYMSSLCLCLCLRLCLRVSVHKVWRVLS